ncbi:MAG: FlgB family protein [Pseudomonadota bacterium]
MLDAPNLMKMAQSLARHSGARQAQIARNIANADVPGYRARDVASFSESLNRSQANDVRTTREGHLNGREVGPSYRTVELGGEASPNGNNVSVDLEMARGTDAKSSHDLALAVYKSSMDILRTSIGRGR